MSTGATTTQPLGLTLAMRAIDGEPGEWALLQSLAFDLTPFVRVGRERTTQRAKRYKDNSGALAEQCALMPAVLRLPYSIPRAFGAWLLSVVVDRPRRVDNTHELARARACEDDRIDVKTYERLRKTLGQNGDWDNYGKTVCDALTGILWFDDELIEFGVCRVRRDAIEPAVHIAAKVVS